MRVSWGDLLFEQLQEEEEGERGRAAGDECQHADRPGDPAHAYVFFISLLFILSWTFGMLLMVNLKVHRALADLADRDPLTGIGNSGTMAHDWSMHATGLDLGQCFEPGGGVQAVRLETAGGSSSLGVKRMRLVLHGAVY